MDLAICINTNSLPAATSELGKKLMIDSLAGVLQLIVTGNERVHFYYDSNSQELLDLKLAENYSYEDFISDCGDVDLQAFLYEVEDKSPALDTLTEEQFSEVSEYALYIPNQPLDAQRDIYSLAWVLDGYLLSLATAERWNCHEIRTNKQGEHGQYVDDFLLLKNIANEAHGRLHFERAQYIDLANIVAPHCISNELKQWFDQQSKENQRVIVNKLKLATEKGFQGAEPLFKPLSNSTTLREIRFSAFAGGAIRILFRNYQEEKYLLLTGFIKHSNKEGYDTHIPLAEKIYQEYIL
ncbi:hypothetical protein AKN94_01075 [Thiopseudomonas alkaliphila]|uniref:type II toxin-antitoxin system RelE/ParE family toxin n=1 Tax=Thiopseudomonas alkaliphila TaxID=1697053 RepID=UPI00069EC83E|nr:type II toxin-antitoxin system RelE/ParE family toxin [Thiopseudomonas alkaliphila]AKX46117.1 hypothetical protein AKN94_01075 [Thiopseudomonas alkaliphila]AKX56113.1 hypothetical protein AKN90_10650 [Thiopseudomonas alkaliphila]